MLRWTENNAVKPYIFEITRLGVHVAGIVLQASIHRRQYAGFNMQGDDHYRSVPLNASRNLTDAVLT